MKKLLDERIYTKSPAPSEVDSIVSACSGLSMIGGTSPYSSGFPPSKESSLIDFSVLSLFKIEGSFTNILRFATPPIVSLDGSSN